MIFITKLPKPAAITYLSICAATIGISLAFTHIGWAMLLLFACAILDMFDGSFARSFKRSVFEKKFGIAIDSLADVLAFIALPCIIFFSIAGTGLTTTIPVIFAICGITRLAVFTAESSPDKTIKYYRGLPVTVSGLLIPITFILSQFIFGRQYTIILSLLYVVIAVLFVVNIKIKKP